LLIYVQTKWNTDVVREQLEVITFDVKKIQNISDRKMPHSSSDNMEWHKKKVAPARDKELCLSFSSSKCSYVIMVAPQWAGGIPED
jgi:hypothetical protein